MAASPLSHVDSLYVELQVHALSVSDDLAKALTTLGTGSLTTILFYEAIVRGDPKQTNSALPLKQKLWLLSLYLHQFH